MPKNIEDTKFFAEKYFDFLITDFGFEKVPEYYAAHEYHFGYRKGNIEIDFACEADGTSLPWVVLRNFNNTTRVGDKEFPEYFYLIDIEMTNQLKKIFNRRSDRYFPSGSQRDYDERGRNELEILLSENAEIIKRHPQILAGNLKVFPKRKKDRNVPTKSFISIKQVDGTVKTYISAPKREKGIVGWIKSLFN